MVGLLTVSAAGAVTTTVVIATVDNGHALTVNPEPASTSRQ